MTASTPLDPISAQKLVARFAAMLSEHAEAQLFPASTAALPAPKAAIKEAVRIVLQALASTDQMTDELRSFLEETFVALANYVDAEMAALASEHRRASEALEADPRQPQERFGSPNWTTVARTSRLAGEIARGSAEEASALRSEFQSMIAGLRR
jgi:cell division septum initiation protein DivIVA